MDRIDALVNELPDEVVDLIGDLQDQVEDLTKRLEDAEATPVEVPTTSDPIAKALASLDPEVASVVKSQADRLAEAEARLAAAEAEKADAAYIAKARAFDGVVASPEEFGPALRRIAETHPNEAAYIEKALAAASERIRVSKVFDEIGHGISTPGSAFDRATAIAKSKVDAGEALDIESARADVWTENPSLYAEFQQERR